MSKLKTLLRLVPLLPVPILIVSSVFVPVGSDAGLIQNETLKLAGLTTLLNVLEIVLAVVRRSAPPTSPTSHCAALVPLNVPLLNRPEESLIGLPLSALGLPSRCQPRMRPSRFEVNASELDGPGGALNSLTVVWPLALV